MFAELEFLVRFSDVQHIFLSSLDSIPPMTETGDKAQIHYSENIL